MKLSFHRYKYYPYERQLALREVKALLGSKLTELSDGIEINSQSDAAAKRLVYFSEIQNGLARSQTIQARLELNGENASSRQATRYSVHGLHEYKGKFNPQIAKALLNIFEVGAGDRVLDPFCGSGTTLVECAHMGAIGVGMDINPLAVFLANAKIGALGIPASQIAGWLSDIKRAARTKRKLSIERGDRETYLLKWFDKKVLAEIETVRRAIESVAGEGKDVLLAIASNLLRDYSLQDPKDLRIRRRTSPLPSEPFLSTFIQTAEKFAAKLAQAQLVFGCGSSRSEARLGSVTVSPNNLGTAKFDAALTSPPYAMALPYIDTQRLSLVWLNLVSPAEISPLEAELVGSREMRGGDRRSLSEAIASNKMNIAKPQYEFCVSLQNSITPKDGFRRKAVPALLYRYFWGMQNAFSNLRPVMKRGAPFALIVGHNHTVLGGIRHDINTPHHLAELATHCGWSVDEMIELQTYRRFGYHVSNAISSESLLILRNN